MVVSLALAIVTPVVAHPHRVQLSRGNLAVEILVDDPAMLDEFGPRFDRLGYVREIRLNNVSLLGPWGLPDEFGLSGLGVLGYADAQIGENFVKIGVGSLQRKSGKDYFFSERYPLKELFPITITHQSDDSVHIAQKARPQGLPWHYDYEKTYRIEGDSLDISYTLSNRGDRPFTSEHYNHHWFTLGAGIVGPYHVVETAFPLLPPERKSPYNFESHRLWPKATIAPSKAFYYATPLKNVPPAQTRVRLSAGGLSVTIQGDFSPSRFAVYAQDETICPEIFFTPDIAPGETVRWKMSYRFSTIQPASPLHAIP